MDVLENGIFRCLWICSQNISKYRNSCPNGPYLIVLQLSQIWALFKREREWEKPTTDCKVILHKSFSELFLLVQCTTWHRVLTSKYWKFTEQNYLFTTPFLPLLSSKQNVTENSFKTYNKFMNSKLANWPKTAQIYFYSVTPSYMRLHTGLLKCFVLNNLCTPKHFRTLYKALFLRPWSVSIQGAQGVGHWLPWDPLEIHVLRMWWEY